ncbi:radical SAM protein [Candidatus Dependentiae bacterium]|nr:radical SAM protein [Candidatus Dependentiae bacterium]
MKKKVCILTSMLLCEGNSYLSSRLYKYFIMNDYEIVSEAPGTEAVIVNTCIFDEKREKDAFDLINNIVNNAEKNQKIIIIGCLANMEKRLPSSDKYIKIGLAEGNKFDEIFKPAIPYSDILIETVNPKYANTAYALLDHFYLKLGYGCANKCSYCIIRVAKGMVKSEPIKKVLSDFETGLKMGHKKFILLIDDIGSYGIDIGTNFAELLNEMLAYKEYNFQLSMYYIFPGHFLRLFDKINKEIFLYMRLINIPLQSTSQRILKMMNRNYDVKKVLELVEKIKTFNPSIKFRTHIMYGFPTETREEFEKSFEILPEYFDESYFFCYSDKEGTESINYDGKISNDEKISRTQYVCDYFKKNKKILLGYYWADTSYEALAKVIGIK